MKRVGNLLLLSLLLVGFSVSSLSAQAEPQVESSVEATTVGEGEHFNLTIKVSSEDELEITAPQVPGLEGFNLLNTSASQFVNRRMVAGPSGMEFQTQRSVVYTYTLMPTKKGRLQIPPFEVVIDGKVYNTKPILMNVVEAGSAPARRRGQLPGFPPDFEDPLAEADELFQQLLQRRGLIPPGGQMEEDAIPAPPSGKAFVPKNANEAFIVHLDADKEEVFEGEQITATWYVYVRGQILNLDRSKFPDLKGFWKEVIEEATTLNFATEVINGQVYKKALLASYALFPIKPGTATVDPYRLKATVQVSNNPASVFGFGPSYTLTRASENTKIKVKPLPTEGRPGDFSGAVGQFEVTATVENPRVNLNQPFSLKLRFEGKGNAKLIELPNIKAPPGLEVYETKTEAKFFKNGRSYKEFDILLIPRQEGKLEIPAVSASLFDPETVAYYSKSTLPIAIEVLPGQAGGAGGQSSRLGEEDSKLANAQPAAPIGPRLPELVLTPDQSLNLHKAWRGSPFVFAPSVLALLILFGRSLILFRSESRGRRLRRALNARMKKIDKLMSSGDWRGASKETTNVIYSILGEISGLGGASAEVSRLLAAAPPSLRRELGAEFEKLMEIFQTLSFAPEAAVGSLKDPDEMKKNIRATQTLLEKAIRHLSDDAE